MSKDQNKNLATLLRQAGFEADGDIWSYHAHRGVKAKEKVTDLQKSKKEHPLCWDLTQWTVRETDNGWHTVDLKLSLDTETFVDLMQKRVVEHYGQGSLFEVSSGQENDLWIICEFIKPKDKDTTPLSVASYGQNFHSPCGIGGCHLVFFADQATLYTSQHDFFGVGYIPQMFFLDLPRLVAEALRFDWQSAGKVSLFEQNHSIWHVLQSLATTNCKDKVLVDRWLDRPDGFFNQMTLACDDKKNSLALSLSKDSVGRRLLHNPVIEVLEARELRDTFGDIDDAFLRGDLVAMQRACLDLAGSHDDSLGLIRRAAILDLVEQFHLSHEQLAYALRLEPNNKLFVSCAIKECLRVGSQIADETLLQYLSSLGESLYTEVHDPDNMRTLEVVLPELLGDAWFQKNPETAEACYKRVVEKRGNLPRVLTKMALLRRSHGKENEEVEILNQLLTVERRRHELANIYLRLASLHREIDPEKAIEAGLSALEYAPGNFEAVTLVSEVMVQSGNPKHAIQVLANAIASLELPAEIERKAELEIMAGQIWEKQLKRKDLARERYNRAIADGMNNEGLLRRLLIIFREHKDAKGQAQALEGLFSIALAEGQETSLRQLFDELKDLLENELDSTEDSVLLHMRLAATGCFNAADIAHLMRLENTYVDWEGLYTQLTYIGDKTVSREDKEFYFQLGLLARERLHDEELAAYNFHKSYQLGHDDRDLVGFLEQHYEKSQDSQALFAVLKRQLDENTVVDRLGILKRIYQFKELLSPEQLDDYAVIILQEDEGSVSEVRERFRAYGKAEDCHGLEKLLDKIIKATDKNTAKIWALEALGVFARMKTQQRFSALAFTLSELQRLGHENDKIREAAFTLLGDNPDAQRLRPFVLEAIAAGEIPALDRDKTFAVLGDDALGRARLHALLAEQVPEIVERRFHAKEAWKLFRELSDHKADEAVQLVLYGTSGKMTNSEIDHLYTLVEASGRWDDFIEVLEKQIDFVNDPNRKAKLARRIIDTLVTNGAEPVRALEYFQQIRLWDANPHDIDLDAADFAFEFCHQGEAKRYILLCLDEEACWEQQERIKVLIKRMSEDLGGRDLLEQKVVPFIESISSAGNIPKAVRYCNLLSSCGVYFFRLGWLVLEHHVRLKNIDGIIDSWYRCAASIDDRELVDDFLERSADLFTAHNLPETLEHIIRYGMREGVAYPLNPSVQAEINLNLALQLFNRDVEHTLTLQVLGEVYKLRPNEERAWLPLCFLLRESAEHELFQSLLQRIIPYAESNPGFLNQYPVTLESLRNDLQLIRSGKSLTPKKLSSFRVPLQGREEIRNLDQEEEQEPSQRDNPAFKEDQKSSVSYLKPPPPKPLEVEEAEVPLRKVAGENFDGFGKYSDTTTKPSLFKAHTREEQGEDDEKEDDTEEREVSKSEIPPPGDFIAKRANLTESHIRLNLDWRQTVLDFSYHPNMTRALFNTAFERELEKHMALQSFALLSGEMSVLKDWQFPAWRNFKDVAYDLVSKKRLPNAEEVTLLNDNLYKILITLVPVILTVFEKKFSVTQLASNINIAPEKVMQKRRLVPWKDPIFENCGIGRYRDRLQHYAFTAFDLEGLQKHFFYDVRNKAIYFDQSYYNSVPPSHLLHRLIRIYKAAGMKYHAILSLDPGRHLAPFLSKCREIVSQSRLGVIKRSMGIKSGVLETALQKLDQESLQSAFETLNRISRTEIVKLVERMKFEIYKRQLAESLDLIGIIESLTDLDLIGKDVPKPLEIATASPVIVDLIKFVTVLEFD